MHGSLRIYSWAFSMYYWTLADAITGCQQVMSELIAARPLYGSSDLQWAQWIATPPAARVPDPAPIRRQIHLLSRDNMA